MKNSVIVFSIICLLTGLSPFHTMAAEMQIAAGGTYTIGLTTDGDVVAVGDNSLDQINVSTWDDMNQIFAAWNHTYGVKSGGSVIATGENDYDQLEISSWNDISQIVSGDNHTVGLKSDGTVAAIGDNSEEQLEVSAWSDIKDIAAGVDHTVGLKNDGTVITTGNNFFLQCDLSSWTDIKQIAAGGAHTIGLKNDDTIVWKGWNSSGQLDLSSWTDIKQIETSLSHTVGLKNDGTVVAVGNNDFGQLDVDSWTDIKQVAVGTAHTVGLKYDGTVVATGNNDFGQLNVSSWNLDLSGAGTSVCSKDLQNSKCFPSPSYPDPSGVCRIRVNYDGGGFSHGTGFLVAPDLILTAWHVFGDGITENEVKNSYAEFFWEFESCSNTAKVDDKNDEIYFDKILEAGKEFSKTYYLFDLPLKNGLINGVDFCLVRLKDPAPDYVKVYDLETNFSNISINQEIVEIAHMDGGIKMTACGEISSLSIFGFNGSSFFQSDINNNYGTSGSPVFDASTHKVIGIDVGDFWGATHLKICDIYDKIDEHLLSGLDDSIDIQNSLSFYISNVDYNGSQYRCDFLYWGEEDGKICWALANVEQNSTTMATLNANAYSNSTVFNSDLSFQIKNAIFNGTQLWAEFKFLKEMGGAMLWYLADFGTSTSDPSPGYKPGALLIPNGGETWLDGKTETIEWSATDLTGQKVDLFILQDDPDGLDNDPETQKNWYQFASQISNIGYHKIDPSVLNGVGNGYRIKIVDSEGNYDISDANFNLNYYATSSGDYKQVIAGYKFTAGLKKDGTIATSGYLSDNNASSLNNITKIFADNGTHLVGLTTNSTAVAVGWYGIGQKKVASWSGIKQLAAGPSHTVGLKDDGTVMVALGLGVKDIYDVSSWADIIQVAVGDYFIAGLKSDGTVVVTGSTANGISNVSIWNDIKQIAASDAHILGLKNDGTVVTAGCGGISICDVSSWADIIQVSAGNAHTVGLKNDGTVMAVGENDHGECDVSSWTGIKQVAAGGHHTVGLKDDGNALAVGYNFEGQCEVFNWDSTQ